MYRKEPLPPFFQRLIGVGYHVVVGAALGFACAIVILTARAMMWGDQFGPVDGAIWATAYAHGALFGAIYYPLARSTLLEKENPFGATVAACLGAVVIGIIGFRFAGPAPPAISASIGFWGTCAAIYQRRKRDRNQTDFGSYFR